MPQPTITRDQLGRLGIYTWTEGFRPAVPQTLGGSRIAAPTADPKDFDGPDEDQREFILSGMNLSTVRR